MKATLALLLVLVAGTSGAQSSAEAETKIRDLFEKHCSECHSDGDEEPTLTKGTDLAKLLTDKELVNREKPESGELFHRVTLPTDSRRRMPKSKGAKGDKDYREPLSQDEQAQLLLWITGKGSDAAPAATKPAASPVKADASSSSSDPKVLAQKVQALLTARCTTCHSKSGGERSKSPFMTDLADLRTSDAVDLANPQKSKLWTVLTTGEPTAMPLRTVADKEAGKAKPDPVSDEDIAMILTWIAAGAPTLDGAPAKEVPVVNNSETPSEQAPETPKRVIVTAVDEVADALQDLQSLRAEDQRDTRWVSLSPQHNFVKTNEATMTQYRLGVRKMLNHLSTAPDIAKFVEVGRQKTLFRVRLRDLGWDAALWENMASHYPLYVATDSSVGLQASTGTSVPIIRADWLAAVGMRPPLYHDLLRLPKTVKELEHQLGVTVAEDIQRGEVVRYALNPSGVSQANRLIERHVIRAYKGYYWVSYDFRRQDPARVDTTQLLSKFPLGPASFPSGGEPMLGGSLAFKHAGGEFVFSLPNGLNAYYVADVAGNRLDGAAPTDIVFDDKKVTGRVEISNGLSCVRCHDQGIKPAAASKDVVFAVMNGFSGEALDLLRRLHPGDDAVKAQLATDTARFHAAMKEADALPADFDPAKPGEEVVGLLADWFDTALNLDKAAAELGLSSADFIHQLDIQNSSSVFNNRVTLVLNKGTVDRVDFLADFVDLMQRFHTGVHVRGDFKPLVGETTKPHRRPVAIHFGTDKATYQEGEIPALTITAAEACHLRLLYQDARGDITVLFPNQFIKDDRIKAGKNQLMPAPNPAKPDEDVAIEIFGGDDGKTFGTERFIAVATDQPFTDTEELLAVLKTLPEGIGFADAGTKDLALAQTKAARAISRARATSRNFTADEAEARSGISVITITTKPKQ